MRGEVARLRGSSRIRCCIPHGRSDEAVSDRLLAHEVLQTLPSLED